MSVLAAHMIVPHICLVLTDVSEGHGIPCNWSYGWWLKPSLKNYNKITKYDNMRNILKISVSISKSLSYNKSSIQRKTYNTK